MSYFVQERVFAPDLRRRAFPDVGVMVADFVLINTTTMTPVTGLLVPVAANRNYAIDCYIAYDVPSTVDVGFALQAGSQYEIGGPWTVSGTENSSTNPGLMEAAHVTYWDNTVPFYMAGDTESMSALLAGGVRTGLNPTAVQVTAGQGATSASALTIRAGSWIRATVMD